MFFTSSPRASRRSKTLRASLAALACVTAATLAACSHGDAAAPGQPAEAPELPPPAGAAQGAPGVNPVPTATPAPQSTKDGRSQIMAGLVADRANARYSDQPARTMPVAVRPLSDAPPAVSAAAVAKLDDAPPARPAEAAAPAPPRADAIGPASRSVAAMVGPRRVAPTGPGPGDDDDVGPAGPGATRASLPQVGTGFRTLTEFDSTIYGAGHLLATLDFPAGTLSASERSELGAAAEKQKQTRGVVRVIGHGPTKTSSADRATTVARELERLGVPRDQIFTGSETASGPTEVFVHY